MVLVENDKFVASAHAPNAYAPVVGPGRDTSALGVEGSGPDHALVSPEIVAQSACSHVPDAAVVVGSAGLEHGPIGRDDDERHHCVAAEHVELLEGGGVPDAHRRIFGP